MKKISACCLILFMLLPLSSQADEIQSYGFEITNSSSNNNQCVTTISMKGINTTSVAHILLDDEVVWDASDISNPEKTVTFKDSKLSFSSSSCHSVAIHTVKAIFENGIIVSQLVKSYGNNSEVTPEKSPKGWGWGIRKSLLWIADNITNQAVINHIRDYGGSVAANTWINNAASIASGLRALAAWETITIDMVYDQAIGGLMGIGVSRATATSIATALKIGLQIMF